jgi:Uma2 family endonuclease
LQPLLGHTFTLNRDAWGVIALTDVRVQVKATRFRVPDLTVLRAGTPRERILTHPPLLVIEILSPEDRLSRMTDRCGDYLEFGIENIWILDPVRSQSYRVTKAGLELSPSGEITVPGTPIRVALGELFAELNKS